MSRLRVFIFSFLFLCLIIAYNLFICFQQNGQLVYPLDDTYIHMAIAKNLSDHGVWGATKFGFSSTSSSILYTLVLAIVFAITGISIWAPFIINLVFAAVLLYFTIGVSLKYMNAYASFFFHAALILFIPLPAMTVLGMEHVLHAWLCLLFLWLSYRKWQHEKVNNWLYGFVAAMAVLARYESMFVIGITAGIWLLVFRNGKQFLGLCAAMALPLCLFGIYSIYHGGYFFPNSLLAKSNFSGKSLFEIVHTLSNKVLFNSMLASLLFAPVVYWIAWPVKSFVALKDSPKHLILFIVAAVSIVHLVLANYGWFFRYEAYLIAMLLFGVLITWNDWKGLLKPQTFISRLVIFSFSAFMFYSIWGRVQVILFTNMAMKNIGDQQVQMAKFVQKYFPSAGMAINDIGAVVYYNDDLRVFDMEGLATTEILKFKRHLDKNFLRNYVKKNDITIGIFYPHRYNEKIPPEWEQVGEWTLTDNFVTDGSTIGFYVLDPSYRSKMIQSLQEHSASLPANIIQTGKYIDEFRK